MSLNEDHVPCPTRGAWGFSTINGNRTRLNNEIYIGRLVWNRLHYLKDPKTGKRVSRLNPEAAWVIRDVPDLRIIDQDLWDAVKARQKTLEASPNIRTGHSHDHFRARRRPKYLFSGVLKCGCCQGVQHDLEIPAWLFERPQQGASAPIFQNIRREVLEDRVSKESLDQQSLKLETRRTELEALLASSKAPPPLLHPEMAGVYREQIFRLHEALNSELETQRQEAAEIVRSLIEAIILTPSDDGMRIDVCGDLAGILTIAFGTQKSANANMRSRFDPTSQFDLVAGAGFEPAAFRL